MEKNKFLRDLNNEQALAVTYNDGPLAIIAAAGSGKTRVIVHKIAYLVEFLKVKPWRILAVTFTNKAAAEMQKRVISMTGEEGRSVNISTYHSLCARILRSEIKLFDYPSNFTILDQIDQKQVLAEIYKKLNVSVKSFPYPLALSFISRNKLSNYSYALVADNAKNEADKMLAAIYKGYVLNLHQARSLDFDDLLIFVSKLFKEHPEVATSWARKFDYVLIDEFQDTSYMQYEIIKSLIAHERLTIVGDPDQTIYSWRRADVSLINNFQKHFKNAKIVLLEKNYRSTNNILDKANVLIKNNTRRIDKKLQATISGGEDVEYFHGFSDDDEARWIAMRINDLVKSGEALKSIAILYRANYLSASIEKALIGANIKYIVWGGTGFYQRQEIKDAIAYLKIINNGDEVSMRRMINIPPRKIGATTLADIYNVQEKTGESLYSLLVKNAASLPLVQSQRASLANFMNLIERAKKMLLEKSIAEVIDYFLITVGYLETLDPIIDLSRIENLKELSLLIRSWERENTVGDLAKYLQETSLFTDRDVDHAVQDYVTLMTVHTAKGLEFDSVFIAGFSESVFPSSRSLDDHEGGGLEEERRLAYVAITRARKRLFISDSRGFSLDHSFQKRPSRFLKEMGISASEAIRDYTPPPSLESNYVADRNIITGDEVIHASFGLGVVVSVQGELVDIAFRGPHGVKTLMKNHKSLQKVSH